MADAALPILMYHGVHATAAARGVFDRVYSVAPTAFNAQLDRLAQTGYRTLRLRELNSSLAPRVVVITFDDGDISNLEIALPPLIERDMRAEFFVSADLVGRPGRLSAADLRTLVGAGMSVQSHALTHRYLDDLSASELETELRDSKRRIEDITQVRVTALALPGGRGGAREFELARRVGYEHVLGSEPGCNRPFPEERCLQRLVVTRDLALGEFTHRVRWQGMRPRALRLRYAALAWVKRALGNRRYDTLRRRMLST
jgi:peptidoglycan/xylan/chitin deacetylase (PgdA/CDA1 family)